MTTFRLLEELYGDRPMQQIWSSDATIAAWLSVEGELAQAQAAVGVIAGEDADAIARMCRRGTIDADALWESGRNVGYPILGLVRQVAEQLPAGPNGRVHFGATTQDIMDSGLALQLVASCERIEELLLALGDGLLGLVTTHAGTVMVARTHAQHAVPTTFGAKAAVYLHQVTELVRQVRRCRADVAVVSLFGAGGTNAATGADAHRTRDELARRLGLSASDIPWHVARQHIVGFGQLAAVIAAVCVRLAREVVDLSRNEIAEVAEQGGHHRGASSTMPQKANPIHAESIIGFGVAAEVEGAGLIRAAEAQHERSAGEWQSEWLLLPQVAEHTASALALAGTMVDHLEVDPVAMGANLASDHGLAMSEAVMMRLARHVGRERAHDLVYLAANRARANGTQLADEYPLILADAGIEDDLGQIRPGDYLGEAARICTQAATAWREARASTPSAVRDA